MCGIVGFKSITNYQKLRGFLPEAVQSLTHRGPDDSGLFFEEKAGIGLAHRRLSIIDLSRAGHQPMTSDDGQLHIIYNGEIYNFKKIRETLEEKGHKFKSSTDTEVILKAYLQWGIECFEKLVGMFALALWDSGCKKLYLARDRMGIKPLYFYYTPSVILFASELKALMAFKQFPKELEPDAIPLFLHYQYIPAPRTIFKNTYKLLPGHILIHNDGKVSIHAYWKLPEKLEAANVEILAEEEALEQLDSLLEKAVSDHMVSDVPLGALLSGGIDSSTVVALMQKVNSSPVRTFSIGFREKSYNEAAWAAKVAKHLETDHTELYVTPNHAMDVIPKLPDIYDEPFADSSAIPTLMVSHLIRSHVTVALSGDGGDEQFAGYTRYWTTKAMETGFKFLPKNAKKALALILRNIPSSLIEQCYSACYNYMPQHLKVANFSDKWQKLLKLFDQTQVSELYRMTICLWSREDIYRILGRTLPESQYEEAFKETEGWPLISRLMRIDQKTYLPDAMLTKVDRASMAASLEVRVPFLDHRILEYTSSIPDRLKYRNGTGKYLLKKLLNNYVPKALIERPKMGFGVPIERWLRKELKELLLDYLSPEAIKKEGLFNHRIIDKKIKEHLSGQASHQYRLWSLLMWEMWRERWLGSH